jgi:sulfonate transport system substrate-binding protein
MMTISQFAPSTRRRTWLQRMAAVTALGLGLACNAAFAEPAKELRIGFQKSASLFVLQKAQGTLERRLAPLNVAVKWVEFPAGPQLLEGLNVGAIDVGFVGEAPPIFAQAAGARFVYVGNDPAAPQTEALVVPKDSPLKTVADLKGKRIALNKGSNVHYLLVKLLEKNNLKYSDVTPVFLAPADARAAFEKGAVDAWVIWDPFLAAAEKQIGVRQLGDGTGIVNSYSYYLAQSDFAQANPHLIHELFANTLDAARFVQADIPHAAALIAPLQGLDPAIVETSLRRCRFGVVPLTPAVAAEQQKIADTFYDLKLIPKQIRIADALPSAAATAAVAAK